jgi:hypothetical protein
LSPTRESVLQARQMIAALHKVDEVLRGGTASVTPHHSLRRLVFIIFFYGIFYGAVMGTYGGLGGTRVLQPVYSGLKVPMLLLVTFVLSIPSFYVLNMLLGLGADFPDVVRALVAAQAVLTIVLVSLSPFTLLWYTSFTGHDGAILFNAFIFFVASLSAQWILRRYYKPLIARHPRHQWLLRLWLVIYAFVGIQMGWVLRPFIGEPHLPTTFFRPDSWGNAYLYVAEAIRKVL